MTLEMYEILILITIRSLVGIGMSFIGQTGQGFHSSYTNRGRVFNNCNKCI